MIIYRSATIHQFILEYSADGPRYAEHSREYILPSGEDLFVYFTLYIKQSLLKMPNPKRKDILSYQPTLTAIIN